MVLVGASWTSARPGKGRGPEVQYANEDFKLLDSFEAHRLSKADTVYAKGEYKLARSEYDAFILEFPKTKALAFALLRKARCLHQENKRYEAIKAYQEVLDYFPNEVRYWGRARECAAAVSPARWTWSRCVTPARATPRTAC